jgi:hypothetical protein
VCIAYSVTIYVSGFGKCESLVIVCIFAWILLENIVYCFIRDHDFNIFWLLVFQLLRFYLHWWDINCRNGHMQNLNFLQFRYFVIYFVIFVSMDWETESVVAGTFVWIFIFLFQVKVGLYHADFIYMCIHKNNVVLIFLLFVKWNTIKHSYHQSSTKGKRSTNFSHFSGILNTHTTCYNH